MSNTRPIPWFLDEESQLFIDLDDVQFMWLYPSRQHFEMKLASEKEVLLVAEPIGKKIFQALKAYRSPPEPAPAAQDPRVSNVPWLSERQKASISSVIASFGPTIRGHPSPLVPNPIKPGVIGSPEEKINSVRESSGAEFMRSVLVGHGPETSSTNIIAPEAHAPEKEHEWRYCSISSDSNSESGEDHLN